MSTTESGEAGPSLALPDDVVDEIVRQIPGNADRLLSHLRTAAALLEQVAAEPNLRLAETVAYNVRETLDSVVASAEASEGGLGAVHSAWQQVLTARTLSPDAEADAVINLLDVVKRSADSKERENFRARQLIEHVRSSTGVEPYSSGQSMVARFNQLRQRAAGSLHNQLTGDSAEALYRDAVEWLSWMFLPPDRRAVDIEALAAEPYTGQDQVQRLRELCANPLQLGRFALHLADPSWLEPLYSEGLFALPTLNEPLWPVDRLALIKTHPAQVTGLIARFTKDLLAVQPKEARLPAAFTLLRTCVDIGPAAVEVADQLIKKYGPQSPGIRGLSVHMLATGCDPRAPVVETIARQQLQPEQRRRKSQLRTVLNALRDGATIENVRGRTLLIAHGLRNLIEGRPVLFLDVVPLSTDPGSRGEAENLVAYNLLRLADAARTFGYSTEDMRAWFDPVPNKLGSRLVSQLLCAADAAMVDRIAHIATCLERDPAGDERDLVHLIRDEADADVRADAVATWATALGVPSAEPDGWAEARVWRWLGILPDECFTAWNDALRPLIDEHGRADPSRLDIPTRSLNVNGTDSSPITAADLAAASGADAVRRVNAWRPEQDDQLSGQHRRHLASAFERAAEQRLADWAGEADAIVAELNDPVMVVRFLRALAAGGPVIRAHLEPITRAMRQLIENLAADAWPDLGPGRPRTELEGELGTLTTNIAQSRDIALDDATFDTLWNFTTSTSLVRRDEHDPVGDFANDPLGRNAALNEPWGKNLEAVLALAAHRHRNLGSTSPGLVAHLDRVRATTGLLGRDLHAIIAVQLPFLLTVAPEWAHSNFDYLVPDGEDGDTVLLTVVERNRPVGALLERWRERLRRLAPTHPEPCLRWLLVGAFWRRPGYTIDDIIDAVGNNAGAATELCRQISSLVQDEPAQSEALAAAITYWQAILDSTTVPTEALRALSGWALVTNIDDRDYLPLMMHTLAKTGGELEDPMDVADHWREHDNPIQHLPLLQRLLPVGEPWQQAYVAQSIVECLRAAAARPLKSEDTIAMRNLRAELIDRGHFNAHNVTIPDP